MSTKPVVAAVDGSEDSLRAAEWAALEARRQSRPLRIVSAPALVPRLHPYQASPEVIANALRGVAARALDAAITRCEEIAPGLPVTTGLLSGEPALAVAASGSDASMLVVGARGAGGFAAMILGSVSRYVASRAACPVVVVREESMAVHREIVVGVRDPQGAGEALAFAFEEAALRGADLVAVHTWYWIPAPPRIRGSRGSRAEAGQSGAHLGQADRQLAAALAVWRDKYPAVNVRGDVIHGHPARVLASYSARADLVVLAGTVIPRAPLPASARFSTRSSTMPTARSRSSRREPDEGDVVKMKTIGDIAVEGHRVLVRADLNVPLDSGRVMDDGRIRASLPTLTELMGRGARVIICAHLGRPGGHEDLRYSLAPVAARLAQLLDHEVAFPGDIAGPAARCRDRGHGPR